MRKFKKFRLRALAAPIESRQQWVRSRTFRSLLFAVAGALLLLGAGAIAAILYAAFHDNDLHFAGNPIVISPAK